MRPPSYMRSVVGQNVVMRRRPILLRLGPEIYYYLLEGGKGEIIYRTNIMLFIASSKVQTNSNFRRNN